MTIPLMFFFGLKPGSTAFDAVEPLWLSFGPGLAEFWDLVLTAAQLNTNTAWQQNMWDWSYGAFSSLASLYANKPLYLVPEARPYITQGDGTLTFTMLYVTIVVPLP
ncbi:MAG: hypothetical protein Q8R28_04985 [Dehalococcoidia bacterium]|nr:hypothetical protein [Dehalococcoidia bacterium]